MKLLDPARKMLLICLLLLPVSGFAGTGIAFVHGTGNQVDAYNEYWTAEMIESVRQGLPDPDNYLVVNCDFDNSHGKTLRQVVSRVS